MKNPCAKCIALFLAPLCLTAENVTTEPIGFNKVICLANSDTVVGVPLRQQGSLRTVLTAPPAVNGDSATLTFAPDSLTPGALTGHFLKFVDGDRAGRWYDIQTATTGTANTASTVTISLNGDTLGAAAMGDHAIISQYWTLSTLFPPVASTGVTGPTTGWTETPVGSGTWVPNGHAIVASTSTLGPGRRTEILLPNLTAEGVNIPAEGRYYIHAGIWKKGNFGNTSFNSTIIYPDTHFRISNSSTVAHSTVFRSVGEVEMGPEGIPLSTSQTTAQDNYICIPRPISVTLNALNLLGTGAFVSSTNTLGTGRRDELLVFDNALQLTNKAPSFRYYVHGGVWKLNNGGNTDRGLETIQPGAGIMIRKYLTSNGATVFWSNTPSY